MNTHSACNPAGNNDKGRDGDASEVIHAGMLRSFTNANRMRVSVQALIMRRAPHCAEIRVTNDATGESQTIRFAADADGVSALIVALAKTLGEIEAGRF